MIAQHKSKHGVRAAAADIVVGKDVLELLSSAMYLDPMSIYREYIQNSADAIDEAKAAGILPKKSRGRVTLDVDASKRRVKLTDNGVGVANDIARRRLLSIGASYKRAGKFRGFRGVGRLAGLGYCRELVFRSKAAGDKAIVEFVWDCRELRSRLRDPDFDGDLSQLINSIVTINEVPSKEVGDHFFEVELRDIVRHRNDALLDVGAIQRYLAQVAPVPFNPEFQFASAIEERLAPHVEIGQLDILVNGSGPLYRPISNSFEISDKAKDTFSEIEFLELAAADGKCAAIGWILHHSYLGAIPNRTMVKGLRARCGDIQVGEWSLFEEQFPETRFNAWTVGEIHVIDRRIVPNGRRDHFEQNIHFNNIQHQITPIARDIGRRCRSASIQRNRIRGFERHEAIAKQNIKIVSSGLLETHQASTLLQAAEAAIRVMERIIPQLADGEAQYKKRVQRLKDKLPESAPARAQVDLSDIPTASRRPYKDAVAVVYECCRDPREAAEIVKKIHARLSAKPSRQANKPSAKRNARK